MSNKTFSTITLRNLDSPENADVVEILNDFMHDSGKKTGQSAIEGIIRKYYKLLKLSKELQTAKRNLENELAQTKRDWEAENKALTKTLNTFSIFLADVAILQEGIPALQELQKSRNQISTPSPAFKNYSGNSSSYTPSQNNRWDEEEEEEEEEYDEEEEEEDDSDDDEE